MALLYDAASVIRSKNAGPFLITLDVMFDSKVEYERIKKDGSISKEKVAKAYQISQNDCDIIFFDPVKAVKVTLKRWGPGSGSAGDRDIYGAQQHAPLGGLEVGGIKT
jgi:hypothetical protein